MNLFFGLKLIIKFFIELYFYYKIFNIEFLDL